LIWFDDGLCIVGVAWFIFKSVTFLAGSSRRFDSILSKGTVKDKIKVNPTFLDDFGVEI
jgi:hypothetical protein